MRMALKRDGSAEVALSIENYTSKVADDGDEIKLKRGKFYRQKTTTALV
jgi:hypothetical protein